MIGARSGQTPERPLFNRPCRFILSVANISQLPPADLPEVAFIGRSNVGKSSLINALVNQKNLARTSATPGRTRLINYFEIDKSLYLVDLPGYGYAKVLDKDAFQWQKNIYTYFQTRDNLRRVFLLIDSRHGLKQSDIDALKMLSDLGMNCQIVYTKTDKIKQKELEQLKQQSPEILQAYPIIYPTFLYTSANKRNGLEELKKEIASLV